MRRIHIPNLYWIQGQPFQGKSSLTAHFRKTLTDIDVQVIQTDRVFWRWCDKYRPKETRQARKSLGRHFPALPNRLKREWFEYLTNYLLSRVQYAKPDMVVEGWLLTLFPQDLKDLLKQNMTILTVTMHKYTARTSIKDIKPVGSDYTKVVSELRTQMQQTTMRDIMPKVRQRFEDLAYCAAKTNNKGRFEAFGLPLVMTGMRILEVDCDTGYNAIRTKQRGAEVWACDRSNDNIRRASRIANAIYTMPDIKWYRGDLLESSFKTPDVKFDYILINKLFERVSPVRLLTRLKELLKPSGCIVVEVHQARLSHNHPQQFNTDFFRELSRNGAVELCPNGATVAQTAKDAGLVIKDRLPSIKPVNTQIDRFVYYFAEGGDNVDAAKV